MNHLFFPASVLIALLGMPSAFPAPALSPLGAGPEAPAGLNLFVGPAGSDSAAGTKAAPFATLAKARDTVRALHGKLPAGGVTVWLLGDVRLAETFALAKEDSGTADRPVTYRAVAGVTPRLIAGTLIDPAKWKPLGAEARKRVHPKVDPDKLREFDVSGAGLTRTSQFAPKDSFSTEWFIIDLFANDRRQPVSRWPNPRENVGGHNDAGWTTANGSKDERAFFFGAGGHPTDGDATDDVNADGTHRAERWRAALASGHEVWLKGFWRTPWEPWTMRVEEINPSENWIRLRATPSGGMGSKYTKPADGTTFRVGNGKENWLAINLLEEIDQPGEWALDTKDQKIYYYPPAPIGTLRMMISDRSTPVVRLENVSFVNLLGLRVEGGMGHGLEVVGGADVCVAGCTIVNYGSTGIRLDGTSRTLLQSNDISDGGGSGLELRALGNRAQLVSSGVMLLNNHVHHIGQLAFKEAIGMDSCVGVSVAHNLLHDLPKGGIRTDLANNCTFEFNEIHNNALCESDTGVFYNYGGWTTYGNVYRYNFSHHTNRSNGIYCDDGDSGDFYSNNIVQGAIGGILFGGGHDNIAQNNIFIETKGQSIDDRGISRKYFLGTNYEKRLLDMKPLQDPWKAYGARLRATFHLKTNLWTDVLSPDWHPEFPNGCAMIDNVGIAAGAFKKPKTGDVEITGNVSLSDVAAAGFADYASMDLRTKNPEILAKFPNLNEIFPQIGLQTDAYRKSVPTRKETGGLSNRGKDGDTWNEDQMR